jgi:hypothetical protein
LMANHPMCKQVEIPDYLYDGKHIRSYWQNTIKVI